MTSADKCAIDKVTIITVCYESTHVLKNMLSSIPNGVEVILVDNCSKDLPLLRSIARNYNSKLIELKENIGFGRACNIGAKGIKTPYLLFLNPDTELTESTLIALVEAAEKYPDAVALNPAIRDKNGSEYLKRGSVLIPRRKWHPRGWPREDCEIPVLSGAALFVRRADFEYVDGFDPNIFLYHEDDDLALRLAKRGKLVFVRASEVIHQGGRSSARTSEVATLKAWHMGRSRVYAARKHEQPHGFKRALTQAVLQLISPIVLLSARKRAKQVSFLRGVWSMR